MGINALFKKSVATIKYEGANSFIKKSLSYTKKRLLRTKINSRYHSKDILFINGCSLPHPPRYRVDHQVEQLHFNGYSCDTVYYEDLDVEMVRYYRAFVFFRCPHTAEVEKLIERAKYFNKTVFFDIDDLVIDYKYVKEIDYLKTMRPDEFEQYMDGVNRTQQTLKMCDYAITTTDRLAKELSDYVGEVFINRNVASEKMVELSLEALKAKEKKQNDSNIVDDRIIMGYFSGSITHNEDFNLIISVVKEMFAKHENVYLKVVGILDIPEELSEYKDRIIFEKFTDWTNLPDLIANVHINLAPLVQSIFNEAKSENKWTEAALVKVPTIASNLGAFKEVVRHEQDGILCDSIDDWRLYLDKLITDTSYRSKLGQQAYNVVMKGWTTLSNGYKLFEFIESKLQDNIAFVLPSTQISGGVNVVIKHCNILRDYGKDVTIISMSEDDDNIINKDGEINVISYHRHSFHGLFKKCVATLWSTTQFLNMYPKIKGKYYLVQNFETNFYEPGNFTRVWANLTYNFFSDIKYITISKWCEQWLSQNYGKNVSYVENGIDLSVFQYRKRTFEGKIKVLVEGNSKDYYKNVDESFKITNQLDSNRFEIWYLSYNGEPKEWYKVDKFLNKVPHDQVGKVYADCDILLKSSLLESFSYPPLEMMATGGIAVVAPNEGNIEYLVHNKNCLLYEQGNTSSALQLIEMVCSDVSLRERIIENGLKTARSKEWERLEGEILALYGYEVNHSENKGEKYEAKLV
ncbi:glycosyltransferase [Paenibacillus polymyxa]|uniref:glycosyltransferase n=1 Tax=Paenibacillus polymyxa TaxID=1406 RepID=UPI002AB3FF64|nr:glycosyltransferase [Paenibacillus polymyxa]MDY7991477.1 glycosyltransferase [Paenibacillus polymyxa]MDY8117918.1 glycosyltransferase [Paenibacillus polymyxa]